MARNPKFTAVATELQQRIEAGDYTVHEPMPSEQTLAAEFGVNRLTLRKALNVLADSQLIVRKPGRGTFVSGPAQSVQSRILYVGDTQGDFYRDVYSAVCAEAQDHGKAVTALMPSTEQALEQLPDLCETHGRIICSGGAWRQVREHVPDDTRVTRVSDFYGAQGIAADDPPGYVISTDLRRAAELAVEHLLELGHTRLTFMDVSYGGEPGAVLGPVPCNRPAYIGFRCALLAAGLEPMADLGVPDPQNMGDDDDFHPHHRLAVTQYLETIDELPTAIVVGADFRVSPLLSVLRQRGLKVPQDVSIVGIGNTSHCKMLDPQLTSVCLGESDIARLAIALSEEATPPAARIIRVGPELINRDSTAPRVQDCEVCP